MEIKNLKGPRAQFKSLVPAGKPSLMPSEEPRVIGESLALDDVTELSRQIEGMARDPNIPKFVKP